MGQAWTLDSDEWPAFVLSAFWALGMTVVWLRVYGFPKMIGSPTQKRVEWERDRVLGLAKGLGGTAVGFLVALVTAYVDGDIADHVSTWSVVGCIAGAVGCLMLAAAMNASTRDFVAQDWLDQ